MKRGLFLLRPAWIIAAHFAVFALARAALYWIWPASFEGLSTSLIARAWTRGFVIDASIIAIGLAPVVLALSLPFEFATRRGWRSFWAWIAFAHLCAGTLVLAGDIAYFGTVGRHLGPELASMVDDPELMVAIVREAYLVESSAVVLALVLLGFLWKRCMRWDENLGSPRAPAWTLLALAPIFLVAIRGNVSGKPIGTVDAFESGSVSAGYLALNGPFSIAHSVSNAADLNCNYMPWDEAVANVQRQIFAAEDRALDPEFPLLRARAVSGTTHPNVVVLLLEGWDADVVDVVRGELGMAPLGLTPNFDALSRQGVLFTNLHAAGQRSARGILAVLAGIPSLPGLPYLGNGIEQSRLSFLGRLALGEGYSTYFLQGSPERSFRIDAIAALAGFERYLGKQGVAAVTGRDSMAEWGAWDQDLLQASHGLFEAAPQPFLGVVFTTSTHLPYQVPEGHPLRYPSDSPEHAYWNSVHYADGALGEYFAAARAAGYFDRTIFVLVSDHRSGIGLAGASPRRMLHIPCLVIAPGLAPRIERGIRSQIDILPTVAELANWQTPHASLGRSLLDETDEERGALCQLGEVLVRLESRGWVMHDLTRRLDAVSDLGDADLDAIEGRLLADVQVLVRTLATNRVEPAAVAIGQ